MKKSLNDEEVLWKDNREKVLAPRKDASYCICDMAWVGMQGQKCKTCGKRNDRRRLKK